MTNRAVRLDDIMEQIPFDGVYVNARSFGEIRKTDKIGAVGFHL